MIDGTEGRSVMASVSNIRRGGYYVLSRRGFEDIVRTWAWHKWSIKEQSRRDRDWHEAQRLLGLRLSPQLFKSISFNDYILLLQKIRSKAEEVYRQHKDADALEDWLEAERDVCRYYRVDN